MKENETAFKQLREDFWRAQVQSCTTPAQALATLEKDAGLSGGKAIWKMREYRPDLYNGWRRQPPEFKPVKNAHMQHFRVIGG